MAPYDEHIAETMEYKRILPILIGAVCHGVGVVVVNERFRHCVLAFPEPFPERHGPLCSRPQVACDVEPARYVPVLRTRQYALPHVHLAGVLVGCVYIPSFQRYVRHKVPLESVAAPVCAESAATRFGALQARRASIHYYPTDNMYMQLNYTTRVGMPALAELSETDQWVDTRLIYHGNAGLVPYHRHILSYNFGVNSKYLDLSFEVHMLRL
mgnify:CR=1 FL=1